MDMYLKAEAIAHPGEVSPDEVDKPGAFIPVAACNESICADDSAPVRGVK